jgi:lysozyme family protein
VLKAEGGYVNHPNDPGGATKFGISSRSYPGEDIPNMTIDRAKQIFINDYYNKVGGDTLMNIDPKLAAHVSDMAFNAGPGTAVKLLYDAVDLPRKTKITPELLSALGNKTELAQDYTNARMNYYSGLGNAGTFLKGWTNRVNNLNKALESGAVVRDDTSQAPGKIRNATAYISNTPTPKEKAELEDIAREGLSTYYRNSEYTTKGMEDFKQRTGFWDATKAFYDEDQYNYTTQVNRIKKGLAETLAADATKALAGKVSQEDLSTLTRLIKDRNLDDDARFTEFERLKMANPKVDLERFSESAFTDRFNADYEEKAKRWAGVYTGEWSDGPGTVMSKLGQMLGGYLPATIANIIQDPAAIAANLVGGAPKLGVTALAKAAAKVGGADYVQNLFANESVKGTEAERSMSDMAIRAAGTGLGFSALAGLGHGIDKMWRKSSKGTAAAADELSKIADEVEKFAAPEVRESLRTMSRNAKLYKEQYTKNPFGTSVAAKQKYDIVLETAIKDISNGVPVRPSPEMSSRFLKTDARPFKIASRASEDAGVEKLHNQAIKDWDDFKKEFITFEKIDVIEPSTSSFVPATNRKGEVFRFQSSGEAEKFLRSPEGIKLAGEEKIKIVSANEKGDVYLAQSAPIESFNSPSTAITSATLGELDMIPNKALTSEGIENLNKLYNHPGMSHIGDGSLNQVSKFAKQLADTPNPTPRTYREYMKELAEIEARTGQRYSKDAVKIAEKELDIEANLDPDGIVDFGEGLDASLMSKKQVREEMNEQKNLVKEFSDCISGGGSA